MVNVWLSFIDWLEFVAIEKDTEYQGEGDEPLPNRIERMQTRQKRVFDFCTSKRCIVEWDFQDRDGKPLDFKNRADYNQMNAADYNALYHALASAANPKK